MTERSLVAFGRWSLALVACLAGVALAEPPRDDVFDRAFVDVAGDKFRWPKGDACRAVALVFVGHDCPISNGYSREIERLREEFAPRGIAFCVVYADADLSEAEARKHAREYGFRCPALFDPKLSLARRFGATIKPEAAVVSTSGETLYRGRIDDRYVDFGKRREHAEKRELRDALVAIVEGKPIAVSRTEAIGCDIDFAGVAE